MSSCCSKPEEPIKETKSACCASESKPEPNAQTEASCCGPKPEKTETENSCCPPKEKTDYLMWGSAWFVGLSFIIFFLPFEKPEWLHTLSHTSVEMFAAMWWGVVLAIFFVGVIGRIPRELVMAVLGKAGTKRGLLRATGAGLLLDLCNHGILMVGMRLYERGASLGQVMAFLIASPWNSLTLTLILFGLVGVPLTLTFILGSAVIALISGVIFDRLVLAKQLPANPNHIDHEMLKPVGQEFKTWWQQTTLSKSDWSFMLKDGLVNSKMVLRWLLFGIVLVSFVRVFFEPETFAQWFGASASGLFLTLLATTLIETCSEGSSPIAADLVNRANAPGNGFVFLMAGVSTDYTEIMSIKDTTKSWKIALFLPLVTVPQVIVIGWLLNQ
jgi:uncharacterized membrane protein YraQ (UPF0718 family)